MSDYREFLKRKAQAYGDSGFAPHFLPDALFDFQKECVTWAQRKGRAALFQDCGLGKTVQQLVWAQNVVEKTNRPVLILTPLAVSPQTVREGEKFGIECWRSGNGKVEHGASIYVTNYERLHHFDAQDFAGVVCDESSILKSFDGITRSRITEFMRKLSYRLLCTATAAPNDYIELGTSSEALGYLGHIEMLNRFFKNDQNTVKPVRRWTAQKTGWASQAAGGARGGWRFKGHAEEPFWRWVCSWARALRRPSDLGFEDGTFLLPPLTEREHVIETEKRREGMLFSLPAVGLAEQRQERRITLEERCQRAAELVNSTGKAAICWCQLNDEGNLLERLIPDAIQVSGRDGDDEKEEKFLAFGSGEARVLVCKPVIGAWGLNWQHCAHVVCFASHSFEQYYQGVRRCWRFGQKSEVVVDNVVSKGEQGILENLKRKSRAADRMFDSLVRHMSEAMQIEGGQRFEEQEEIPAWL